MGETIVSGRDWKSHWDTSEPLPADPLVQVGRTVGGVPISAEQVDRLVFSIQGALDLQPTDVLADLCCGNGLITRRLAASCDSVLGVDYARELIEVAKRDYARSNIVYACRSADELWAADFPGRALNKVCMNQGMQYFDEPMLRVLLARLEPLTKRGMTLFLTDIPDADRLRNFYNTPERFAEYERRRAAGTEALGTWWSADHLRDVFEEHGYAFEVRIDPARFTGHYRFDVLASRP